MKEFTFYIAYLDSTHQMIAINCDRDILRKFMQDSGLDFYYILPAKVLIFNGQLTINTTV